MVVLDAEDALLLALTRDPDRPHLGVWWELPGGGLRPGEDAVAAAVREVAEETGITVRAADLVVLPWRRSVRYWRRGHQVVQAESVLLVRLAERGPATSLAGLTEKERREVVGLRWFSPVELRASRASFWPARLVELLPDVLAGRAVDEPEEDRTGGLA